MQSTTAKTLGALAAAAFMASFAGTAAAGATHKCVNGAGAVTYTNQACAGPVAAASRPSAAPAARAQPVVAAASQAAAALDPQNAVVLARHTGQCAYFDESSALVAEKMSLARRMEPLASDQASACVAARRRFFQDWRNVEVIASGVYEDSAERFSVVQVRGVGANGRMVTGMIACPLQSQVATGATSSIRF